MKHCGPKREVVPHCLDSRHRDAINSSALSSLLPLLSSFPFAPLFLTLRPLFVVTVSSVVSLSLARCLLSLQLVTSFYVIWVCWVVWIVRCRCLCFVLVVVVVVVFMPGLLPSHLTFGLLHGGWVGGVSCHRLHTQVKRLCRSLCLVGLSVKKAGQDVSLLLSLSWPS